MRHSTPQPAIRSSERATITSEVELEQTDLSQLGGQMRVRFARKDYARALAIAEVIVAAGGEDADAKACAEACRAKLMSDCLEAIGSLEQVPTLVGPIAEIDASSVDRRAGVVLSQVDGVASLGAILDVTGMPSLDALRIVRELVRRGIVVFRGKAAARRRAARMRAPQG
jgi:hypothetical protein